MPIGVTSFISKYLSGGRSFSPEVSTRHSADVGLSIGRFTDSLVRKVIAGKAKLSVNDPWHKRALWFFDIVRQLKLTSLVAQVPVKDASLGIRTSIDVTARNALNKLVVIELKTTQDTKKQHKERYFKRCRQCPTLSNGLPNTEFWRHALQCGFGMMCTGATQGVVIVVCSDGAVYYPVSSTACDKRMFAKPRSVTATEVPARADCKTIAWPVGADGTLLEALKKKGFTTVKSTDPIVLEGPKRGLAAAIIVHKPPSYKNSRLQKNHTETAKALGKQLYKTQTAGKRGTPKRPTRALLISLGRGGAWEIEKVGAILKPK